MLLQRSRMSPRRTSLFLHDSMVIPTWTLRAATQVDVELLFPIHRAAMRAYVEATWGQWDDDWQKKRFVDKLDSAGWHVIDVAGEIAGMVSWEDKPSDLWLADIEIHPRFQGKGIGTAIIRSLAEPALAKGKPVTLRVLHANIRAQLLYERLGFREFRRIETHVYLRLDPTGAPA